MNLNDTRIETERLLLVPIEPKYAEEIYRHFTAAITTYMKPQPTESIDGIVSFIENSMKGLEDGTNLQLVITDSSTGEFLGCAGLHHPADDTPELGIWVKQEAHGRNIGREAIAAMVQWASENLQYEYLRYPVERNNIPSRKIPESLRAAVGAEYRDTNHNGSPLDMIEYRIYRSQQ